MNHERQVELLEAVLDQTTDNAVTIKIENKHGSYTVTVADRLGELGDVSEKSLDVAMLETWKWLQSWVDELND